MTVDSCEDINETEDDDQGEDSDGDSSNSFGDAIQREFVDEEEDIEEEDSIIDKLKSIPKKIIYGASLGLLAIIISALIVHKGKAIMASHYATIRIVNKGRRKFEKEKRFRTKKYTFHEVDDGLKKIDEEMKKLK